MKQPEDNMTAELPGLERRGRRPIGDVAMTAAQRMKAYRARLAQERFEVRPSNVSRVTLIKQLSTAFDQLDKRNGDQDINEGAQYMVEGILAELITRYGLNLASIKRKVAAATKEPRG